MLRSVYIWVFCLSQSFCVCLKLYVSWYSVLIFFCSSLIIWVFVIFSFCIFFSFSCLFYFQLIVLYLEKKAFTFLKKDLRQVKHGNICRNKTVLKILISLLNDISSPSVHPFQLKQSRKNENNLVFQKNLLYFFLIHHFHLLF